ncbi:MAG TPA: ribosomal-processing cysteine protease Prp, partial [Pseudogracilibacillus sp.]|nr:ribosomal-processing cysteine protease Prp [Pseudogracilibacillus sp.]
MITVTICRKNDKIQSFEISGHANSGPYGYDLVCAAVSAVSFGAVNAALQLSECELDIEQGGEGGYLAVSIPQEATAKQVEKIYQAFEV